MNFHKKRRRHCLLSVLVAFVSSVVCAQPQTTLNARFSLDASSDSNDVKNRHYKVMHYIDGLCNKPKQGARLYRKKFGKQTHSFPEVEIPVQDVYFFQMEYSEKRRQGDRACAALIGFQPLANRIYKAVYATSGQVSRCELKVYDVTSSNPIEVVDVVKPERTCDRGRPTNNKNSVPVHTVKPLF